MKPKQHKCPICKDPYQKQNSLQKTCFKFECIKEFLDKQKAKKLAQEAKKQRKADKDTRLRLKPRREWLAETQQAVNAFRRNEELAKGRGCISCGRTQAEVQHFDGWKPGGLWDAGHFVGVGANPTIRLEPKNIWLQCKSCNAGSGKYARKAATVAVNYERNLRAQEGDELVDWLKGPHEPKKYTIDQLKELKAHYAAKLKELR